MASAAIQAPEAPESVNRVGRIFGALLNPKATFESIARRPTWVLPVILLCIVQIGLVAVYGHRAGWRGLIEKQVGNSSRFQQLSPADQQAQIEVATKIAPKVAYAEVIIGPFVVVLLFAGIFWLIFNLGMGGKFGFITSLGVISHALMPGVLLGLVGLLIVCLKDPTTLDLQHLVASNAGAYLPSDSSKGLAAALRLVDIFLFWEMILIAIGYHAAAPKKVSFTAALAWVLGLWFVVVLITGGLAAFS
jgi:Yip1 domain